MRANEELTLLAQRKAVLQARIAERREQCTTAVAELAPHLEMVDGVVSKWRTISASAKLIGGSAALSVAKTVVENVGGIGGILRFGASLFGGKKS